jgi:uncharacterized protein
MQLAQERNTGGYMIKQYQPGEIHINNEIYTQSIIVCRDQIILWQAQDISSLKISSLTHISNLNPQILLLGTGCTQQFLPEKLMANILEQKIGLEVMDTHAACRTYNLLASEGRKVVAALLI